MLIKKMKALSTMVDEGYDVEKLSKMAEIAECYGHLKTLISKETIVKEV